MIHSVNSSSPQRPTEGIEESAIGGSTLGPRQSRTAGCPAEERWSKSRLGRPNPSRDEDHPEQTEQLDAEEDESNLNGAIAAGADVRDRLADASREIQLRKAIKPRGVRTDHRPGQHHGRKQREIFEAVQVGAIEAPVAIPAMGNTGREVARSRLPCQDLTDTRRSDRE